MVAAPSKSTLERAVFEIPAREVPIMGNRGRPSARLRFPSPLVPIGIVNCCIDSLTPISIGGPHEKRFQEGPESHADLRRDTNHNRRIDVLWIFRIGRGIFEELCGKSQPACDIYLSRVVAVMNFRDLPSFYHVAAAQNGGGRIRTCISHEQAGGSIGKSLCPVGELALAADHRRAQSGYLVHVRDVSSDG